MWGDEKLIGKDMLIKCIVVGIGGSLGAISRVWTGSLLASSTDYVFPWGTLAANLLGSFLLAFILTGMVQSDKLNMRLKLGVTTGFLGSYTTLSSILYDIHLLSESILYYLAYIVLTLGGGFLAALLGFNSGEKYLDARMKGKGDV